METCTCLLIKVRSMKVKSDVLAQIISLTSFFSDKKSNLFLSRDDSRVSLGFFQTLSSTYTGFEAGADRKSSIIKFTAVLDPVSFTTQKIVNILNVLFFFLLIDLGFTLY